MRVYRLQAWAVAGVIAAGAVHGETLYQRDGITLEGTVRVEFREAAVCTVLAENHSPEVYKRLNVNHGQPLHVWRLDFAVRNGSGRRLEQLTAHFGIASEAPPCTSWSGPLGNYSKPIQWANSFQVLQKPEGMGLGEEASNTVFVLAFHDRQPKFDSWNVDYRFEGEAGRESEPAQGSPAFIIVPVPAHATVSLLDGAQPYRRRMPLEPGRYQVEVSAPGYRTHRAWVDHRQTRPHRIELERLPGGDDSSKHSAQNAALAGQLPSEVQVDLNPRNAEQALQDGDAATAREATERLASPQQEHGLESLEKPRPEIASGDARELGGRASGQTIAQATNCEKWGTSNYFEQATASDIQACLQAGSDPSARTEDGSTPLHRAAAHSEDPDVVQALLARDADLNAKAGDRGHLPVHEAAKNENPDVLRSLLVVGADIKAQDGNGATLLHYAARYNQNPEMVDLLLEAGLDVAAAEEDGDTPLHWAAVNENPAVVEALLTAGADANAPDKDGSTPLHAAAYSGSVEVFRALLAAGADIEARSAGRWGLTVMHQAAGNDDPAMVEAVAGLLIAAGVDPMEPSAEGGVSPLHLAAQHNENPAVIEAFVAVGADVHARLDDSQRMPLHHAARWNDSPAVLEVLIAAGADIEARDENGDTPLHCAAQNSENPAVIEALLARGAELEAPNRSGFTPLHDAAWHNQNRAITEALLAAGAKVAVRNQGGLTPLHYAAEYNDNPDVVDALFAAWTDRKTLPTPDDYGGTALHLLAKRASAAVINTLLTAGWDPEARNDKRETALHIAATHNRDPAVIKALIAAGSDQNAQNEHGATPLHRAASSNDHPEVIEALLAAGADPNKLQIQPADGPHDSFEQAGTPLHKAAEYNGNPEVIKALLRGGADPMARTEHGRLPLHEAAGNKNLEVLEVLMATVRGAGLDPIAVRDRHGSTLLHRAALHGNFAATEALLERGADPRARDASGSTPLHYAARTDWGDKKAAIAMLVESGADVNTRDEDGDSPLHIAAAEYLGSTIEALLALGADVHAVEQEGNSPLHLAATYLSRWPTLALARERANRGDPNVMEALLAAGADAQSRNAARETPWDILQASEDLDEVKKSDTYWRVNDVRSYAPVELAPAPLPPEPARAASVPERDLACQIPGYPRPSNPEGVGLSWCPASVDFQVRVYALMAAGAQCAIATGSSSTPEQMQARHGEIKSNCEQLAALGVRTGGGLTCACPPGYGGSGYATDPGLIERDRELQAQRERQRAEAERAARSRQQAEQEQARQAAQRERQRIEARNARILNSDCKCISISDRNGEYTCADDFVSDGTGKPLCDIRR